MHDQSELRRCHEEIRRLTTENQDLRRAAIYFGDLAERLNRQLSAERRRAVASHHEILREAPDTSTFS